MVRSRNNRHLGPERLEATDLYRACDPALLPFITTAELEDIDIAFGQVRACAALAMGLGMMGHGYNVFVLGPAGCNRHRIVQAALESAAAAHPPAHDWCYLHDFDRPRAPLAVRLPAGRASRLRADMQRLVEALRVGLPAARRSERHRERSAMLDARLEQLARQALETNGGELARWHEEHREMLMEIERGVVELAAGEIIRRLESEYRDLPVVLRHLGRVRELAGSMGANGAASLEQFEVNVLVEQAAAGSAPVVYESHPTVGNLLGRMPGAPPHATDAADFRMIVPGALHRANGGFLVLDAERVLADPRAWGALKRALAASAIRIEPPEEPRAAYAFALLEPEPIPLDVKVVLIGERSAYYHLRENDPEAGALFKVPADFDSRIDRTDESTTAYARVVATLARREGTLPLAADAVACVIEHGARRIGDARKLTLRLRDVSDLLREADHWARRAEAATLEVRHVQQAIDAQSDRLDRLRAETLEEIQRNGIVIATEGTAIGQVNGLTVIEMGGFCFGQPARITASVRVGEGEIVDIERETELGGSVHSKGVLILSAYLGARYAADTPLSMAASLVFEQSYVPLEGDSASLAETCALLSALTRTAVKQSLAVTGSVDQHGRVQVIGGLHEKVEAFFDVCAARGLTGNQGVLIPSDNVQHLMLRRDVVEAAREGLFHVYPVSHIDDAVTLLTGVPAGRRNGRGEFPAGTFNQRVDQALRDLAKARKNFDQQTEKKKKKGKRDD